MFEEYSSHDVAVYGGYLDDARKLLQSASGGIATALSEYVLAQGGYVAGVAYSPDFYRAEYIMIHDISDVHKLKGSKYVDCEKNTVYADVKKLVDAGETVLFFGLPCVVAALYKYIGNRPENLLTCELICHGPTYAKVHTEYIAYLERKFKGKVIDFSVRHKHNAWLPCYLYAKFDNGKTFQKPFYETEYGYAFSVLGKPSCYHCKFKGNNRQGDLMIGDFWGAAAGDPYWNKDGVSSVFAETEKGDVWLRSIPGIKLFPATFEKAVRKNQSVIASRKPHGKREALLAALTKYGLISAVNRTLDFKSKVRRAIKSLLPADFIRMLRRVISRLKIRA